MYVKDARLAGVREASADCFMFADADDMLWGETALETHVSLWRETRADIVHFRTVFTDETGRFAGNYSWADPFAPKLDGKDIFSAYTRSEIDGSAIWNKIFSRDLWMRLLPDLQEFPVKQACEDIFLNIRVFFHAQSYRGSDLTGYGFHYRPGGRDGRSLLRASTLCRMLDLLVPQMRSSGGDMEDLARLERAMANFLAICTGRAGIYAMNPGTVLGDFVQEALAQEDNERIIKTLLLGAGVNGKKLQNIYKSITGL